MNFLAKDMEFEITYEHDKFYLILCLNNYYILFLPHKLI